MSSRRPSALVLAGLLLAALPILLLSGCAEQSSSWDQYVSGTKTFKLFTFVPCDAQLEKIPAHQTYYHAWYFKAFGNDAYWISWANSGGKQNVGRKIYITDVWYIGLNNYTEIKPAYPEQGEQNPKCAALLVLPMSDGVKRVFYANGAPAAMVAGAHRSFAIALAVGVVMTLLLVVARVYAGAGLSEDEADRGVGWTIALGILFVTGVWLLISCTSPLQNIEALVRYYDFYNHLPRGEVGDLLPLSWSQVQTLIAGPPFPTDTIVDYRPFYLTILSLTLVWLALLAKPIAFGIYCVHIADPFGELRKRARQRGTPPTPEEYMAVLAEAAMTSSTWELEVLQRRAKALGLTEQDERPGGRR